MILFCLAAHFNESVNAFGMVESAELGGLALSFSTALMFNYHEFVVFLFICYFFIFQLLDSSHLAQGLSNWCIWEG